MDYATTIIRCISVSFCVLVAVIGGCTMHSNQLIAESIQHGADPIKVTCALSAGAESHVCAAVAVKP